jgi:hypothetical protein
MCKLQALVITNICKPIIVTFGRRGALLDKSRHWRNNCPNMSRQASNCDAVLKVDYSKLFFSYAGLNIG